MEVDFSLTLQSRVGGHSSIFFMLMQGPRLLPVSPSSCRAREFSPFSQCGEKRDCGDDIIYLHRSDTHLGIFHFLELSHMTIVNSKGHWEM